MGQFQPSGQAHNDVEITDHEINRRITLESRDGGEYLHARLV
jgi:hypothetical protein